MTANNERSSDIKLFVLITNFVFLKLKQKSTMPPILTTNIIL